MQLSESLTIGIILTLVFGAVFYYLYSRLIQSEKRVSLLENILLDLKVAMESSLIKREELVEDIRQAPLPSPTIPVAQSQAQAQALPPMMAQQDYEPVVSSTPFELASEEISLPLASGSAPVPSSSQDQYDKMSNKELKDAAKARKIKGYTSMTRAELQEALRGEDSGADLQEGTITLDA